MAKKPAAQKVSTKTLGKAKTREKASTFEKAMVMAPVITDEKLDVRQMEKGVKRKAHGPKLKASPSVKKQASSVKKAIVKKTTTAPPTEVKKL